MRRLIELVVLTLALLAVGVAAAVALTDPAGAATPTAGISSTGMPSR